jgi:hypothetical protein
MTDAKEEKNLVWASIVQIGQLVQNSPEVNGYGAKFEQQAGKADADRHTLCKFLDGQAPFTSQFHKNAATEKEKRDILQPSSEELGQENPSEAEQNKRRKRDRNAEDGCCAKKLKCPPPTYHHPRSVATNNNCGKLR